MYPQSTECFCVPECEFIRFGVRKADGNSNLMLFSSVFSLSVLYIADIFNLGVGLGSARLSFEKLRATTELRELYYQTMI